MLCCGEVRADGCYDVVAGVATGAGEVQVHGVGWGRGVGFVELELRFSQRLGGRSLSGCELRSGEHLR